MNYTIIPVTPFQQNCLLLSDPESHAAAVVDPGGDVDLIVSTAEREGVTIEKIFVTHAHIDHAGGAAELAERSGAPIEGPHHEDEFLIGALPQQAASFGVALSARSFTPQRWLNQDDVVTFGQVELEVYHCPGHTPGHVVFFNRKQKLAIVGDVLFQGSIGRTDFPKGDHATLLRSIRERLWPLGNDVTFIPGHGPESTFGAERHSNPFVGDGVR